MIPDGHGRVDDDPKLVPRGEVVEECREEGAPQIVGLEWALDGKGLRIHAEKSRSGASERAEVFFEAGSVVGFRMLDERDLYNYFNAGLTSRIAWMWRVTSGGWLALEQSRAWFNAELWYSGLVEYFIIGKDDCVSVLTNKPPVVNRQSLPK